MPLSPAIQSVSYPPHHTYHLSHPIRITSITSAIQSESHLSPQPSNHPPSSVCFVHTAMCVSVYFYMCVCGCVCVRLCVCVCAFVLVFYSHGYTTSQLARSHTYIHIYRDKP